MDEHKCHICNEITEFFCEDCDQPVCEECAVPFTLQNQLDGTHCEECYDTIEVSRREEVQRKEEIEDELKKKRKKRNDAAWIRYHSSEQIEKRRLAKVELVKKRREAAIKRAKETMEFLKNFF
jgi:hypothetical protein